MAEYNIMEFSLIVAKHNLLARINQKNDGGNMKSYAYYNGIFGKRSEIGIPLSDRAIFFGDAIYDAAIGCGGGVFLEGEHIGRFLDNADKLRIAHSYSSACLSEIFREVIKRSCLESYFLYFQLSRNCDARCHSAKKCNGANLLITVEPFAPEDPFIPLSLITAEDMRYYLCDVKTVNLLPSVIAATRADFSGCDEVVFHRGDTVTECSRSNISIIKSGVLYTHPEGNLILPGITRRHLLAACSSLGIPCRETPVSLRDLFEADEILVTSTTKLCRRAGALDGREVGCRDEKIFTALSDFLTSEFAIFKENL